MLVGDLYIGQQRIFIKWKNDNLNCVCFEGLNTYIFALKNYVNPTLQSVILTLFNLQIHC